MDRLDFIGIGWLIALALIPLLPWALPRLAGFIETMSRYVSRVGVGPVQIELRAVIDAAIVVPTSGPTLASLPSDLAALTSGTGISTVIAALSKLRIRGGAPCGIIDLQTAANGDFPTCTTCRLCSRSTPWWTCSCSPRNVAGSTATSCE